MHNPNHHPNVHWTSQRTGCAQAIRSADVTSWAPRCSSRFPLEQEWTGSNAFMWDGHVACNGRPTDVQSRAQLCSPSHATLRSTAPRAVPLPTQRSADARLATSGAACALQDSAAHSTPGPGAYPPLRSAFGEERHYKHVPRPQSGRAVGLQKDARAQHVVAALVKKCAAPRAAAICIVRLC